LEAILMRRFLAAVLVAASGLTLGCGGGNEAILPDREMTEEEKRKVKEEDKNIADEESQGKQPKPRKR